VSLKGIRLVTAVAGGSGLRDQGESAVATVAETVAAVIASIAAVAERLVHETAGLMVPTAVTVPIVASSMVEDAP